MKARIAALVVSVLLGGTATQASVLAICSSSEGYSYFPSVGLAANRPPEWASDRISSGRITLSTTSNGEFDILFGDASGALISARQDGGKVIAVGQNDFSISILVVYS